MASAKAITSPVPDAWYPTLAVLMLAVGLVLTASFFIYEATSSKRNRSLAKELTTGGVASVFLGFGSLFLLLSAGVCLIFILQTFFHLSDEDSFFDNILIIHLHNIVQFLRPIQTHQWVG